MAKIAVESEERLPAARWVASGEGWTVSDLVCTAGPRDRPFEEQHSVTSIAIVVSGTFQYRSPAGREFMTPGSLLLGNAGDCFSCGHEHGTGDRCIAFSYAPEFFEGLASNGAASGTRFRTPRLPPMRALSPLVAKATGLLSKAANGDLEALAIQLATEAIAMGTGSQPRSAGVEASSLARVTRVVRMIESDPDVNYGLGSLAQAAGLSSYHFLRTFLRVTGATPHQYILRVRLRRAAVSLKLERRKMWISRLPAGSEMSPTSTAHFGQNSA